MLTGEFRSIQIRIAAILFPRKTQVSVLLEPYVPAKFRFQTRLVKSVPRVPSREYHCSLRALKKRRAEHCLIPLQQRSDGQKVRFGEAVSAWASKMDLTRENQ